MSRFLKAFLRTKHLTTAEVDETKLHRCLSTLDLTALGIGGTLGAGVYVVTGDVAKNKAGPAIVISFAIAAVASLLSGLCYAEFGARVPRAGSAYIYSYVTIGELCAFVIGWNMLLEYVFGAAAVAKAWTDFFNAICNDCISDFFIKHIGKFNSSLLSDYPDLLAFALIIVLTIIIAFGASQSAVVNWVFTIINLLVIVFFTVAGLVFADTNNWDNFAPFGFHGIMSGASRCFFAFVGFDVIATSGEETKTPRKSIPRATIAALFVIFVAYECVSVTLTLMLPYDKLPDSSALATGFDITGFSAAKYIVAIGAICGLSSSALNGLFPIPRILYAMASDRLIFSFFAKVNERTGTPVIACAVSGLLTALFAMFFDLNALADMLSIGTLLSYTMVSISVLLLRYKPGSVIEETNIEHARTNEIITATHFADSQEIPPESEEYSKITREPGKHSATAKESGKHLKTAIGSRSRSHIGEESVSLLNSINGNDDAFSKPPSILSRIRKRIVGCRLTNPTEDSYLVVKFALLVFILTTIGLQCCLVWGIDLLASKNPLIIVIFVFFLLWILLAVYVIARQPESKNKLYFKVPFLPYLPLSAVFVNLFLLLELSYLTWIRFAVWITIGMTIYLFYGVKNSVENEDRREGRST